MTNTSESCHNDNPRLSLWLRPLDGRMLKKLRQRYAGRVLTGEAG